MKVKTNELSGTALDWAVFEAEYGKPYEFTNAYKPSEDWAQGGPIIERERIELVAVELGEEWIARDYWKEFAEQSGPTPLVAAMRCYVASKLGEEVEVPNEIV
jgi:hypothetical protein